MPALLPAALAVIVAALCVAAHAGEALPPLRPPAVPLVTHDPYFSIWSASDTLTAVPTTHWTGAPHPLTSLIRIDGKAFRIMGAEPGDVPALPQTSLHVYPTRTVYRFTGAGVSVTLTFLTPALCDDLDVLARPITYLTWDVRSADGTPHSVQIGFDVSSLLAVNTADQTVEWSRVAAGPLTVLRAGTVEQPVLAKKGDNLRIDWGYVYLAAESARIQSMAVQPSSARCRFVPSGVLPSTDDTRMPRRADDDTPLLTCTFDLRQVGRRTVRRSILIAYDDLFSIEYFRTKLRPYWRRNGVNMEQLLQQAFAEEPALRARCEKFDLELEADLRRIGGETYRRLGVLAYRQTLAGNKLAADSSGQPLLFPKECFSNGCVATVDVIYPMSPLFLLFSPTLAKAMLVPVLDYAASPRWKWPFAPHDLGTYPKANGQVYGGGERSEENQMPVEESGNLLILFAALARAEGNAEFAARYWPQLTRWAEYLSARGFDPENQLCTDDFAGHLAHNVNLSAKAILGLASYSMLCRMRGDPETAARYLEMAKDFAKRWQQQAVDEGHYRLAFDRPGTWSQKYNLVWDRILGFGLFPDTVLRTEMAWYRKVQNRYGLPLDNRKDYTKLDWTVWAACLSGHREDFDALIAPVGRWLNETSSRVPLTDWYDTKTGDCVGFRARPVVGGVFIKALYSPKLWSKWAGRDRTKAGPWAPLPAPRPLTHIVPAADTAPEPPLWRYTLVSPPDGWQQPSYDDTGWLEGPAGFGTPGTPGAVVRTHWNTRDIWLRRPFDLASVDQANLILWMHHDEDAEVFLNGVLAARRTGYVTEYEAVEIAPAARAVLKVGTNWLAVHCRQTVGGQYVDVGLALPGRPVSR